MDLPTDIRTKIKTALDEAIAYGNEVSAHKAIEDRQKIIDSGRSKIIELTNDQRKQWVQSMKPVWAKFEDEIGKEYIDAAEASNQ